MNCTVVLIFVARWPIKRHTVHTAGYRYKRCLIDISSSSIADGGDHRRRIKAEEKTKVVPAVWGTEFIQFLAALAVLY